MTLTDWLPLIVTIIGSGGIAGAVVALIRVRPEAGQIAVQASEGALIVQVGVIDTLREENKALRTRLEKMEAKINALPELQNRVYRLEAERVKLQRQNTALRNRVTTLEDQLREAGHPPEPMEEFDGTVGN